MQEHHDTFCLDRLLLAVVGDLELVHHRPKTRKETEEGTT
uniref:Uncharacterized protein n=1 Tax=Arundo donax TaxID=35708 RepID=A0A0A8ZZZ3_ARUDO